MNSLLVNRHVCVGMLFQEPRIPGAILQISADVIWSSHVARQRWEIGLRFVGLTDCVRRALAEAILRPSL